MFTKNALTFLQITDFSLDNPANRLKLFEKYIFLNKTSNSSINFCVLREDFDENKSIRSIAAVFNKK